MPKRIQLSRASGWRMPPNTVIGWNCEASCAIFKPIRSQFAAVRLTQSVCHVKGRRLC